MNDADVRYLGVAQTLASAKDAELADLAYSLLEACDAEIGLFAGSRADRIRSWVNTKLETVCHSAGWTGTEVLRILNDDRTRGDVALVAMLAAALAKALGLQSVPIEEIVALSLLIVRLYEPRSTNPGNR